MCQRSKRYKMIGLFDPEKHWLYFVGNFDKPFVNLLNMFQLHIPCN